MQKQVSPKTLFKYPGSEQLHSTTFFPTLRLLDLCLSVQNACQLNTSTLSSNVSHLLDILGYVGSHLKMKATDNVDGKLV